MQDDNQQFNPQPQGISDQTHYQEQPHDLQYYQQQTANQTSVYAPPQAPAPSVSTWFDFSNPSYLKGFMVAAGITFVATNPYVRQSLIKGTLKIWNFLQGSVEEIKEQVQDVKAEMSQE